MSKLKKPTLDRRIIFRVDEETEAALRELESELPAGVRGRTSVVLRRLILDAHRQGRKR